MGMAASQARFLGLTGRKSNTEYQGQQVNQQRSSLANESAGLFNQMTALKVPLPPSAIDYYSSRYTFQDSAQTKTFSLKNIGAVGADGKTTAEIEYQKISKVAAEAGIDNAKTLKKTGDVYSMDILSPTESNPDNISNKEAYPLTKDKDGKWSNASGADYTSQIKDIQNKRPLGYYDATRTEENEKFYTITVATGDIRIVSGYDMDKMLKGQAEANVTDNSINAYKTKEKTETAKYTANVALTSDSENGMYNGIIIYKAEGEEMPEELLPFVGKKQELSIGKINDSEGFEKATKDYEYAKMIYDRSIDDINNKTESIQQQDKGLELRLKQLDTEQKAIQTEMEAVQKVIQKNVETTFKTFG